MEPARPYNVLFLCTGNSARSILAEALLDKIGQSRFAAHSAGSMPKGAVHPQALALLERLGHPTAELRSKSWEEFAVQGAPGQDFVFTVCDNAANEACPVWPGQPMTAHWGIPDPAAVDGSADEIARAFHDAYILLQRRIELFTSLPVDKLDRMSLKTRLDEIGREP
ncbi:MAG: arsenate reductase ArsC [Alphaproteobacteria bacterium]|nr:arsenate reductase ArsC [Alphaproteobacteria bacterium]